MMLGKQTLRQLVAMIVLALFVTQARATDEPAGIGVRHITLTDESRAIKASMGFAGSTVRRIDVTLWYPAETRPGDSAENAAPAKGPPAPLIIYSHGTYGRADNAMHLVNHLVRAGYIVAAPDYPLSSRAAYTKISGADPTDVVNQVKDLHFIIDKLLADGTVSPLFDHDRIATMGHSLGAVTSYFASFAGGVRDPRIKATVLLGAGDPVQAALSANMGLTYTWNAAASVPVLFMSAEHDVFARITGRPYAAYMRLEKPKYEVMVAGGVHGWFREGTPLPADGSNPDCLFFKTGAASAFKPAGCDKRGGFIAQARQMEITRIAVREFLDGYLKGDAAQLKRLRKLHSALPETEIRFEE